MRRSSTIPLCAMAVVWLVLCRTVAWAEDLRRMVVVCHRSASAFTLGAPGGGATLEADPVAPEIAADRAQPLVDRARRLYRDLAFDESLVELGRAQQILEEQLLAARDVEVLRQALLYRGLNELALEHADAAREALRASAVLAPDIAPEPGELAPEVDALYAEVRAEVRLAPPGALSVQTRPAGARVGMDGRTVGAGPVAVTGAPGRHFLRVESPGSEPRTLPIDLEERSNRPVEVELPQATRELAVHQLATIDDPRSLLRLTQAQRRVLANVFGADEVMLFAATERAWQLLRSTSPQPITRERSEIPDATEALRSMLAAAREADALAAAHPPAADERPAITDSPWFWIASGAIVVAGGVGLYVWLNEPPPVMTLNANP